MCMYICLVVQMKYMYEYHEQTNQNKYVASERLGGIKGPNCHLFFLKKHFS